MPYIENALRIALTRGIVTSSCLIQLLKATQARIKDDSTPLGKVGSVMVEILGDGLRLKARVLPSTLDAIIQVCLQRLVRTKGKDESEMELVLVK